MAKLCLSWSMWGLVPRPGIEPGPAALATQNLSHWTNRAVPGCGLESTEHIMAECPPCARLRAGSRGKVLRHRAAAAAKSLQSCLTLCNPIDGSPPGSPVPGILQTRTLEWVAISFSNAWKWKGKVKSLSRVRLLATPWTAAYEAPPSMEFSRQEYRSGCHCLLWRERAGI